MCKFAPFLCALDNSNKYSDNNLTNINADFIYKRFANVEKIGDFYNRQLILKLNNRFVDGSLFMYFEKIRLDGKYVTSDVYISNRSGFTAYPPIYANHDVTGQIKINYKGKSEINLKLNTENMKNIKPSFFVDLFRNFARSVLFGMRSSDEQKYDLGIIRRNIDNLGKIFEVFSFEGFVFDEFEIKGLSKDFLTMEFIDNKNGSSYSISQHINSDGKILLQAEGFIDFNVTPVIQIIEGNLLNDEPDKIEISYSLEFDEIILEKVDKSAAEAEKFGIKLAKWAEQKFYQKDEQVIRFFDWLARVDVAFKDKKLYDTKLIMVLGHERVFHVSHTQILQNIKSVTRHLINCNGVAGGIKSNISLLR
jgi:hypothetical protein